MTTVHDFEASRLNGDAVSLSAYEGQVLLIVNTASQCGLTPQYEGLQKLYDAYRERGFSVLGFPCNQFGAQEPGGSEEIASFCSLNYGVAFPMFEKVEVNGPDTHPLYRYLKEAAPFEGDPGEAGNEIRWNFTKFLIDRGGRVVRRFEPGVTPAELEGALRQLLDASA